MTSVKYIGLDVHQATIVVAVRDVRRRLDSHALVAVPERSTTHQ